MNTGLQDSFNLTWKIALVLHGMAPKTLLDSYEAERKVITECSSATEAFLKHISTFVNTQSFLSLAYNVACCGWNYQVICKTLRYGIGAGLCSQDLQEDRSKHRPLHPALHQHQQ